uniref:Uncharacterized protein n=1 Tax=Ixodes scapularis TaxID=6945 RepID=A0A4D5RE93_IXOSC
MTTFWVCTREAAVWQVWCSFCSCQPRGWAESRVIEQNHSRATSEDRGMHLVYIFCPRLLNLYAVSACGGYVANATSWSSWISKALPFLERACSSTCGLCSVVAVGSNRVS